MLLYKHRLNVALEYLAWVNSEVEGNFKLDPGPETFMAFLQIKGYLNEEKIINDFKNNRRNCTE